VTDPGSDAASPWWKSAVVYQIYPRSFQDSDGDGIGDLPGVLRRVDHLADLGVDVVWFSPLYRSPQDDNGYDISDYQDVDPTFGTLEDLDRVVAAFHERGIKVVMDLVVNHTSDEHPWFGESQSSIDSPKRDWYWWRPARPGMEPGSPGAEPTNWGSIFSGPAWEYDEATGEYYLHLFSRRQPDLNWENPKVRRAVYEMMRWRLDRGVDGFRMDVINFISKASGADGSLPDGPVAFGPYGDPAPHTVNGPRLHEFLQEMHHEVFDGRRGALLLVGETPGATVEDGLLFTDPDRHELDMVFTFEHVDLDHGPNGRFDPKPLDLRDLKAVLGRWQTGLADVGWNALYWNNHDQPRIVSRFGDDSTYRRESATMLATVLHLHRGTPYIYQGEELGMTNAHLDSLESYRDIESVRAIEQARELGNLTDDQLLAGLAVFSRDNARTPVQWDDTAQAGFTTGTPWLPVNPNHRTIHAEDRTRGPRLGLPLLSAAHQAASRRRGRPGRRLHHAAARPRTRLRLPPQPRRAGARRRRQLLRPGTAHHHRRRLGRRRTGHRQPPITRRPGRRIPHPATLGSGRVPHCDPPDPGHVSTRAYLPPR
jgi:oligo-1,6-glucosidase